MIAPDQNQIEIPSKSQIRQQVRFSISSISSVNRSAQEIKLSARLNHWLELIGVTRGDLIFAFWPTLSEEPDFRQWLSSLQSKGIQYALPRLEWPTRTLKFLKIGNPDTDLEIAPNGLAQPRKPLELIPPDQTTAVLVPGLAFDLSGGRLGRGAGSGERAAVRRRYATVARGAEAARQVRSRLHEDAVAGEEGPVEGDQRRQQHATQGA